MPKTKTRDSRGKFIKAQPLPNSITKEDLDIEVQEVSPGFYPNRSVQPLKGLTPEERLVRAHILAKGYAELGLNPPAALLILL